MHKVELFGENTTIAEAPEPSNIIWENLEVGKTKQDTRGFAVGLLIAFFIFLTFLLFATLKTAAGENNVKYPRQIDCSHIASEFQDDIESLAEFALADKNATLEFKGAGIYQCYCQTNSSKADAYDDEAICQQYQKD